MSRTYGPRNGLVAAPTHPRRKNKEKNTPTYILPRQGGGLSLNPLAEEINSPGEQRKKTPPPQSSPVEGEEAKTPGGRERI